MKKFVLYSLLTGCFWVLLIATAYLSGFRYNPTNSVPIGLYKLEKPRAPLQRGQLVYICPIDSPTFRLGHSRHYFGGNGFCEHGYQPLIKPIAALPGDKVTVTKEAVLVNGRVLQNTALRRFDSEGRMLPWPMIGTHTVSAGRIWLISTYNAKSFDSRYWGPLPIENIEGIAKPVWLLEGHPQ